MGVEATLFAVIVVFSHAAVNLINLHAHDKETDGLIFKSNNYIAYFFYKAMLEGCILRYEQAAKVKRVGNRGKGYTNTTVCLTKFFKVTVFVFELSWNFVLHKLCTFLNQVRAWSPNIAPVRMSVCVYVCVFVCVSAPEAINN